MYFSDKTDQKQQDEYISETFKIFADVRFPRIKREINEKENFFGKILTLKK